MHFLLKQQAEGLVAGLPGFHNKTRPIAVLKTRPIAFQGGSPGKNCVPGVKYTFFGREKFAFQGLNIMLLGLL